MHRLNELAARLTPEQIREVEDFAEFLADRRRSEPVPTHRAVSFEGWAGRLAHVDKSAVELAHEAADIIARGADKP